MGHGQDHQGRLFPANTAISAGDWEFGESTGNVTVPGELLGCLKQLSCDKTEASLKRLSLPAALPASSLTSLKSCHHIAGMMVFSKDI